MDQARVDGGVTLPLVDRASLAQAKESIDAGGRNLNKLARQALAAGNLDNAGGGRRGPAPRSGRSGGVGLKRAVAKRGAVAAAMPVAMQEPVAAAPVPPPPVPPPPGRPPAGDQPRRRAAADDLNLVGGALLPPAAPAAAWPRPSHRQKDANSQEVQTDVQNTINTARWQMGTNADDALTKLQRSRKREEGARTSSRICAHQLMSMLQAAIREGQRRQDE